MRMQHVNWHSELFTYYLTIINITVDFNITDVLNRPVPKCSRNYSFIPFSFKF
jgi:hypothetical protein